MNKTVENMSIILDKVETELGYDTVGFKFAKTLMNTYRTLLSKLIISISKTEAMNYKIDLLRQKNKILDIQKIVEHKTSEQLICGDYKSADVLAEIDRRLEYSFNEINSL